METYKAKTYPGKFMDLVLFLGSSVSLACLLVVVVMCFQQEWLAAVLFLIIPALSYFISRLFRRRLGINIFADGIDIHYLPQFFVQRGKTVHLSFADVADCQSAKFKAGRFSTWYLIILLKNGKRYKVLSWLPPFQNVDTYKTNCERDITTAFRAYKKSCISRQA
jgi:hypothetical protein